MEEFTRELKRKCDIEFSRLKSRHRPKSAKKGTIKNVKNNLDAFGKLTDDTNNMVTRIVNEICPEMNVTKEQATRVARDLMRKYLE